MMRMIYKQKNTKMNNILGFSQFLNEAEQQKNIEYIYDKAGKEVEKAVMILTGSSSGDITKLVNKFVETYDLLKEAQESHEQVKEILKDKINASFKEEEKFVTRIVKTVKYALTFSKYTKARSEDVEEVDYKAAIDEMMDLFPDIKEGLKDIIKKHTEIKTIVKKEITGSIKYSHINVNEGFTQILKDLVEKLEGIFKSLYKSLRDIGDRMDAKLDKINEIMKG